MKTIKVSTQPKADTKRLKVADLQPGPQMDALVAEARGFDSVWSSSGGEFSNQGTWYYNTKEKRYGPNVSDYNPSGNGGQAMELVEDFNICLGFRSLRRVATIWGNADHGTTAASEEGENAKIAICRTVIASRFGETVEVEE